MERALGLLLIALVGGGLWVAFARRGQRVAFVAVALLLYVPSYFIWFALTYLQIVPVDTLLAQGFGSLPWPRRLTPRSRG